MWRSMTPEEKKPFDDMAAADKIRYANEMREWESKKRAAREEKKRANQEAIAAKSARKHAKSSTTTTTTTSSSTSADKDQCTTSVQEEL
jgi:hypothetical protein